MTHIQVNTLYLQNLARRTREAEDALRRFSSLAGCALHSSPIVRDGYHDLSQRWDQRRGELAEALSAVADGFDTTWRTFRDADQSLADQLSAD